MIPCCCPPRSRLGAVISMQVATMLVSASDTNTASPSRASISDQIRSASPGAALRLTLEAANSASSAPRSSSLDSRALGIGPLAPVALHQASRHQRPAVDEDEEDQLERQ